MAAGLFSVAGDAVHDRGHPLPYSFSVRLPQKKIEKIRALPAEYLIDAESAGDDVRGSLKNPVPLFLPEYLVNKLKLMDIQGYKRTVPTLLRRHGSLLAES